MLSSVSDLVRFSHALSSEELISRESYADLTVPFYENQNGPSPHGQGWFTTTFEGVEMHWAYGYGDADAALLLRVPDRDLTLVMLSNAAMPSATTMLGYGNPLNSAVVTSFVKNFVLQDRVPPMTLDYTGSPARIEERLAEVAGSSGSRLYLEEAFAYAMLMKLLPTSLFDGHARAWELLSTIDRGFPGFLDERRVEAFDLLASRFEEPGALRIGARLAAAYGSSDVYHPIKSFHSGRIHESLGNADQALRFYRAVADSASFFEQPVKHSAYLQLGEYYARSDPQRAKPYLEALLRYKDMIGVQDEEYQEAGRLLGSFEARG